MKDNKDDLPARFTLHYLAQWLNGESPDDPITSRDVNMTKCHIAWYIQKKDIDAWHNDKIIPPISGNSFEAILVTPYVDWHEFIMDKAKDILINHDDFLKLIFHDCNNQKECHGNPKDDCKKYGHCEILGQVGKHKGHPDINAFDNCELKPCRGKGDGLYSDYTECPNREAREMLAQYNQQISTKVKLEKVISKPFRHSPDFSSVTSTRGEQYSFSSKQAQIIEILYNEGKPDLRQAYILEKINAPGERLRDYFKTHPAWGKLIVKGSGKGTYRLNL